ncbi:hypothetical protein KQX54_014675 [Cotesia glomerata]|uniref:Uncharacterized protein n=1 Tax=Cotesia glomerata TaxID=32391 RepID=A0AAV7ISS8_COTGL|nr:hypothetical protein KQX54_014675 [Cotesia glomerata]
MILMFSFERRGRTTMLAGCRNNISLWIYLPGIVVEDRLLYPPEGTWTRVLVHQLLGIPNCPAKPDKDTTRQRKKKRHWRSGCDLGRCSGVVTGR